jgi:hypothetical protein
MAERDKTEILNPAAGAGRAQEPTDEASTKIVRKDDPKVGQLSIIDGPGKGQVLAVHHGQNDIGRADNARIRLNFGDSTISSKNPALLECDHKKKTYVLRDNDNPNPIMINGTRLTGSRPIMSGDRITIGKTTLLFTAM